MTRRRLLLAGTVVLVLLLAVAGLGGWLLVPTVLPDPASKIRKGMRLTEVESFFAPENAGAGWYYFGTEGDPATGKWWHVWGRENRTVSVEFVKTLLNDDDREDIPVVDRTTGEVKTRGALVAP